MTKQVYFAPAASGKTQYALNLAQQAAVSGQEVRLCLPTGLQAQAWRRRLATAGGALGVHVFTFDRLVAACLNAAGEAYTELNEPVQYRLLRAVIDELPLQHYASLKNKPGFLQVSKHLVTELKSALITPIDFSDAVIQLEDTSRLRELADIYSAYQNQMRAQGWADRVGLHWLAVEALRERALDACRDWPLLIIDGFDDFTSSQLALLKLLADRVDSCVVTLTQAEKVTYPRHQRTVEMVADAFGVEPRPLPNTTPVSTTKPILRHLAQRLFAPPAEEQNRDNIGSDLEAITLREAPDRAAEVRSALRWLKQRIVWDGIPPDQVALLARDITPYRHFIQQIATEFGLPIRLVDGQPLQQSPVIAALLSLLRLHLPLAETGIPSLPRRQVIAAWRSPYFHWGSDALTIASADADLLDTFARQYLIIRGLDQWQAAFAAGNALVPAHKYYEEDEIEANDRLTGKRVQQLQQKFNRFLAVSEPPTTAATMRDFVQWLETLIGTDPQMSGNPEQSENSLRIVAQARSNSATASADVAALQTLKDILRGLVWAEAAINRDRQIDYPLFFSELVGAITATHYFLPPQPTESEILVANVTQVRGLGFNAVAVIGLSEGAFPATISEDPFLRDADRIALRSQFSFPLLPSTQSAEREFFYEAVTRARTHLLLTRPILADNGAEWVASPYWEAVRSLAAQVPIPSGSTAILPLAETASWVEWWESAAANAAFPALATDETIQQQIDLAGAIWQTRQQAESGAWDGDLSPLANELSVYFGPDHIWSASRLETYRTCGYLFFLQTVLDIGPRPEPTEGLDARQLGSLYHAIFEQVAASELPDPLTEAAIREQVTAVGTPILDAAPQQQGFRQTAWWTQTQAEILDNVTRSLVSLADSDYRFFRAEAAFGIQGPPLVIGNGQDRLQLRGLIDRIDRHTDGTIRIIDYKSGGKSSYSFTAFQNGEKLQLPLYALAAQETLRLGTVTDGFYWHFHQAEPSGFQLQKAKESIDDVIQTAVTYAWEAVAQIRSGQFAPTPPDGGCPSYCPAAAFCWQYVPRNW